MSVLDTTGTRLTNPMEARAAIKEGREPDWAALPPLLPPRLEPGRHRREDDNQTEVMRPVGEVLTERIPFQPSPHPRPSTPIPAPDAPPANIPLLARILTALRLPRWRP